MQLEKAYIYQVYLNGSFSKAAEALFITQPALSIAIKKVEQEIGAAIFNRNQRPLTLTRVGRLYIEHIKKELLLEKELQQQIDDMHNLKAGDITIGGTHYMNAYLLPPYIAKFNTLFSNINITMHETSSDVLIEMLKDNKLDFTFSCDEEVIKQFDSYPTFSDHILLAVPQSFALNDNLLAQSLSAAEIKAGRHLQDDCPAVDLHQFTDFNFIRIDAHVNLGMRTLKMFEEAEILPRIKVKVPQLVTAFQLAEYGIGATFISDRLVTGSENNLHFFKLQSPLAERKYSLLLPHNVYIPNAVMEFIKLFEF